MRDTLASLLALDPDSFSLHASIFELGISSLTIIRFSNLLTVALKQTVTPQDLMLHQTASSIAATFNIVPLLSNPPFSLDGALRWLSSSPPAPEHEIYWLVEALTCVHDFTGQLWAFRELLLLIDRPSLGFCCTRKALKGCISFADLAIKYVAELHVALPSQSRARLVGYSTGVQVAHRMALTLEASDMPVSIVLLDGRLPGLNGVLESVSDDDIVITLMMHGASNPFSVALTVDGKRFVRLGGLLGHAGVAVADSILKLKDDIHNSIPNTKRSVFLRSTSASLATVIADTRCIHGDHFDFLLHNAASVASVLNMTFAV